MGNLRIGGNRLLQCVVEAPRGIRQELRDTDDGGDRERTIGPCRLRDQRLLETAAAHFALAVVSAKPGAPVGVARSPTWEGDTGDVSRGAIPWAGKPIDVGSDHRPIVVDVVIPRAER